MSQGVGLTDRGDQGRSRDRPYAYALPSALGGFRLPREVHNLSVMARAPFLPFVYASLEFEDYILRPSGEGLGFCAQDAGELAA